MRACFQVWPVHSQHIGAPARSMALAHRPKCRGAMSRVALLLRCRAARSPAGRPRCRRRGPWSRASRGRRSGRSPWRCPRARARRRRRWPRAPPRRSSASSPPESIAASPSPRRSPAGRRRRRPAVSSTCRPAPTLTCLAPTSADERGQRARLHAGVRRVLAVRQASQQLAGDPVGERLGLRGRLDLGGERLLEVVAQLAAEGELLRGLGAQADLD